MGVVVTILAIFAAVAQAYAMVGQDHSSLVELDHRVTRNDIRLTGIEAHADDWTKRLDRIERKIDGTWTPKSNARRQH